ncbi:HAMP domain-containing histidine kinase [Paenibacillus sp. N1-5-1-14]|nr:HAMP domain-containing histidine kinase [Paenibacillus radicibacter]
MKFSFIYTMRWKFILIFFLSLASAALFVYICYEISQKLVYIAPYRSTIKWVVENIGSLPILVLMGSLLFLLCFFIYSRKVFRFLDEISRGLVEISKGNLHYEIKAKSSDEIGRLADQFNEMTKKLRTSIEEERHAEKTKNELITGVSHDLRTPLTSILGYLELIERDRYQDEVELRYYTKIAYDKSKNLKHLIDSLFEYTSLRGEALHPQFKKINMISFLKQLAEEFNPQLNKAGMTYRMFVEEDSMIVEGDGNQFMRAYENLISNAIRHGSSGRYLDIRIRRDRRDAVIEIVNYGDQIMERDLPYIFDRFYRADRARSSHNGGTGLGLAITKGIIELHHGLISARSTMQETVFETRLPLFQEPIKPSK